MECRTCGNSLAPASLYCPVCGAAPTPASTPAPAQAEDSAAPRQSASVYTVPPAQRAQKAYMGRYGLGNPLLPTPSTLALPSTEQEGKASNAGPASPAPPYQSPGEAAAPPLTESAPASETSTPTFFEAPTHSDTLPSLAPPPPPATRTPSPAAPIAPPPDERPPHLRKLMGSPLAGRLIAVVATLLLIALLAELSASGYRAYKKSLAEQQATTTAQATLHATATSIAQATATAKVLLFHDPLTTNTNGWTESIGAAFFQDGQYHLHNTDPLKTLNSYYEGRTFDDMKVQITITSYSDGSPNSAVPYAYGLVLRADPTAPANKYAFLITPNGTYDFARHDDGGYYNNGWTDLSVTPFASSSAIHIGKGATNTLTVIAKDNTFTLFINGQQVEVVSDQNAPFTDGWIGVLVEGADMEAGFSNLLVYGPDA